MQRELENQMKRSSKTFEILRETVTNTFDTIGDILKPFAVKAAKSLTKILVTVRGFAKENPGLVKFAATVATLVVVFTGLAVAVGLLMAAMSPLIAVLAAMAIPIAALVLGGAALGLMFSEWFDTGHPLIRMLSDMGDEIGAIFTPLGEMLGLVGEGTEEFNFFATAIDKIGFGLMAALTPIKIFLQAMRGVIETGSKVLEGDFLGASKAWSVAWGDINRSVDEGGKAMKFALGIADHAQSLESRTALSNRERAFEMSNISGMDNANAVARNRESAAQQIKISGNIGVNATNGAKIDNAEINLNGGTNLLTMMGAGAGA